VDYLKAESLKAKGQACELERGALKDNCWHSGHSRQLTAFAPQLQARNIKLETFEVLAESEKLKVESSVVRT